MAIRGSFLHIFMDITDDVPANSMGLVGCVITACNSIKTGDKEYFPFVISHPKSTATFNYSPESKEQQGAWIAALKAVAAKSVTPSSNNMTDADRILSRRPHADDYEGKEKATLPAVVNSDVTFREIPTKFQLKIEKAVEKLVQFADPKASRWEPWFEQGGVTVTKKAGVVLAVRAQCTLPYHILQVFGMLTDPQRFTDVDRRVQSYKRCKILSLNTYIEAVRFKQVL